MTNPAWFVPAVVLAISSTPWAQAVPDRNRNEKPFEDEKPRVVPAPAVPGIQKIRAAERIILAGDGMYITYEPTIPPAQEDQEDEEQPPPEVDRRMALANPVIARENFDRWLFGLVSSQAQEPRKLDRLLFWTVENVSWRNQLTDAERAKLQLAGRGDIKHLFDRANAARVAFEDARMKFATGRDALLGLKPLSDEFKEGPFGEGSLFAKTLRKIERERAEARNR